MTKIFTVWSLLLHIVYNLIYRSRMENFMCIKTRRVVQYNACSVRISAVNVYYRYEREYRGTYIFKHGKQWPRV